MGRFSHDGEFSYATWNIRRRRLNGSAELRDFWAKTWTGVVSKKVFRYCRAIHRIVNFWLTSECFTSLKTFRVFGKVGLQLQFLVLTTMQLKYNPRLDNIKRIDNCCCQDVFVFWDHCLTPFAYCNCLLDVVDGDDCNTCLVQERCKL